MLLIGVLTTPVMGPVASFSEFWAFVRYLFAFRDQRPLNLTEAFGQLDSHQKTILSDDFGMGVPIHWLIRRLSLRGFSDGRYYIYRFLTAQGGTYTGGTGKRGPGKSPDFIFLDSHGKYHVVECKGTQSSPEYRDKQLDCTPPGKGRMGGVVQKRTVVFPSSIAGQRLACGLYIAGAPGEYSHLKIVDPPTKPLFKMWDDGPERAADPIIRSTLSQMLRGSGLTMSAEVVAFPRGRHRGVEKDRYIFEPANETAARRQAAIVELQERPFTHDRFVEESDYVGRRVSFDLPAAFKVGKKSVRRVEIFRGVRFDYLGMNTQNFFEDTIVARKENNGVLGEFKFSRSEDTVSLTIGKLFRSEIRFVAG